MYKLFGDIKMEKSLTESEMVVLAKLVASEQDYWGYTTYVFECLEKYAIENSKYIMCIRYPNWDHRKIELEEVGYLNCVEIRAGIDTWFDGEKMVPYKYNGTQFIKFVEKPKEEDHKYVM